MTRRLLFFDFETTGVDPYRDRIVEFAFHESPGELYTERVNPGIPIPAEAAEVHGITDADVAGLPGFSAYAPTIQALVNDAVLVGYASRRFDTVLLHCELVRAGQPGLKKDERGCIVHPEIDLLQLWTRHEDRKLVTAAQRFAHVNIEDVAHAAGVDASVLPKVLQGMCLNFSIDTENIDQLCALSIPDGAIDRDGKFAKREDGVVVFTFGQHKDRPATSEPGFLQWMLTKDFSPETKAVARALIAAGSQRRTA